MATKTKTKALKLRFKEVEGVSDSGEIIAYGNVSNVVDYNNELVETGAYQATLDFHEQEGTTIKMLFQHDPDKVIGVWDEYGVDIVDGVEAFWVKGALLINSSTKQQFPSGFSWISSVPVEQDRKSTRLNSSHSRASRMPSSA